MGTSFVVRRATLQATAPPNGQLLGALQLALAAERPGTERLGALRSRQGAPSALTSRPPISIVRRVAAANGTRTATCSGAAVATSNSCSPRSASPKVVVGALATIVRRAAYPRWKAATSDFVAPCCDAHP